MSLLGTWQARLCPYMGLLLFLILKFFFVTSFRENFSGKSFLKCLVARIEKEETDNSSSFYYVERFLKYK